MLIKIDEDKLLEIIENRLRFWMNKEDDEEKVQLFMKMYEDIIESCPDVFQMYTVDEIVDNDYINNTTIVTKDEAEKEGYNLDEAEAEQDGLYLFRW